MSANPCPNNTWNHTSGCTCVSNGSITGEVDIDLAGAAVSSEPTVLSAEDLTFAYGPELATAPVFRKNVRIQAVQATEPGTLETVLADGRVETVKDYAAGDWIVTNPGGEQYTMGDDKFSARYGATDEPGTYQSTGTIQAVRYTGDADLEIETSWGTQNGAPGCWIAKPSDGHAYIIGEQEFADTYVPQGVPKPDFVRDPNASIPGGASEAAANILRRALESGDDPERAYASYDYAVRQIDLLTPGVTQARMSFDNAVAEYDWRKENGTPEPYVTQSRQARTEAYLALVKAREGVGYRAPRASTVHSEMSSNDTREMSHA